MAEFTGERVIPGEVDPSLWQEHVARYRYAARFAAGKRVVDLGCGTGYGTALLAKTARDAVGLDVAADAIQYAVLHSNQSGARFQVADCRRTGLPDQCADVLTCFELIEHLADWDQLLQEAARLLAPGGLFFCSTPNRLYYAESRAVVGPNPFHAHEFTFTEFVEALAEHFPHTAVFTQNHAEGQAFLPAFGTGTAGIDAEEEPELDDAHFYLAVCGHAPLPELPAFVFLPTGGNLLREREHHIAKLEAEVRTKTEWLGASQQAREELTAAYANLEAQLHQANAWAQRQDEELRTARQHIERLERERAAQVTAYEEKIRALEAEGENLVEWARTTEERLTGELTAKCQELDEKCGELQHAVDVLHSTEQELAERTAWAQQLDANVGRLRGAVAAARSSRWVKLGRALNVGPRLEAVE